METFYKAPITVTTHLKMSPAGGEPLNPTAINTQSKVCRQRLTVKDQKKKKSNVSQTYHSEKLLKPPNTPQNSNPKP